MTTPYGKFKKPTPKPHTPPVRPGRAQGEATLSDRLNPTHPSFDRALKNTWKTLPKKEREALVAKDKAVITERHHAVETISFPFEANEEDHCETSFEAYEHVAPLLTRLAAQLGKTPATLEIYDPYFCTGGAIKHLKDLGFPRVYNKCEDFYAMEASGKLPPYDVMLTNPAYSGTHPERLLTVCRDSGKPFLLLMPNYVSGKPYYKNLQKKSHTLNDIYYVYPFKRYVYWSPRGLRKKLQNHASALGNRTSPFVSFWYIHLGPFHRDGKLWPWFTAQAQGKGCATVACTEDLPSAVKPQMIKMDAPPINPTKSNSSKVKRFADSPPPDDAIPTMAPTCTPFSANGPPRKKKKVA